MAIIGNYGLLQKQIADECGDNQALLSPLDDSSGLASPIINAIQSAIAKWEREPFYFNDFRQEPVANSPFQLVGGQEFYGAADYAPLATLARITSIRILEANVNRYTLKERDVNYLNEVSVSTTTRALPTDYCYDTEQLRIYPIPDIAYAVGMTGTLRFVTLAAAGDMNAWTSDAFDLIRCEAKLILARETLFDKDLETGAIKAIYGDPAFPRDRGYLKALKDETTRRRSQRTRIRPSSF